MPEQPNETEEHDTVTEPTDDQQHEHDEQQEPENASAEAAKYRRRLREVEGEREALARDLDTVRRQLVERVAGDVSTTRLGDVADLWRDDLQVADVLDDAGQVDATKVADAVAAVLAAHPTWAARPIDLGQGRRTRTPASGPSWSDLLDPSRL